MNNLIIKINGTGDKYMLSQMLDELAKVVRDTPTKKLEEGVKWNDGILITEIKEDK